MAVKGKEGVKERKRYIACAKDLNAALGLKPKINVRAKNLELIEQIILNVNCPDNPEDAVALADELQDDTWEVLFELECGPKYHQKGEAGELEEEDEEEDEEEEEEEEKEEEEPTPTPDVEEELDAVVVVEEVSSPKKETLMDVFAGVMNGAGPLSPKEIRTAMLNNSNYTTKTVGVYVSIFLRTLVQFGVLVKEDGKYSMK